jgi:hypothetical protein
MVLMELGRVGFGQCARLDSKESRPRQIWLNDPSGIGNTIADFSGASKKNRRFVPTPIRPAIIDLLRMKDAF